MDLSNTIKSKDDLYNNYNQADIVDAVKSITETVDQEIQSLKGDASKVFICGFSQGACVALSTFLNYEFGTKFGGVIGLSGMMGYKLPEEQKQKIMQDTVKQETPMLLYHGESDPMIPIDMAKMSYEVLDEINVKYQWGQEFGLEHSLSMQEIKEIKTFLDKHMK